MIVDGSYVTTKDRPEDIDILVVLPADDDLGAEVPPTAYNLIQKTGMKRQFRFHFDLVARPEGSDAYLKYLELFSRVRTDATYTAKTRKGILRIRP